MESPARPPGAPPAEAPTELEEAEEAYLEAYWQLRLAETELAEARSKGDASPETIADLEQEVEKANLAKTNAKAIAEAVRHEAGVDGSGRGASTGGESADDEPRGTSAGTVAAIVIGILILIGLIVLIAMRRRKEVPTFLQAGFENPVYGDGSNGIQTNTNNASMLHESTYDAVSPAANQSTWNATRTITNAAYSEFAHVPESNAAAQGGAGNLDVAWEAAPTNDATYAAPISAAGVVDLSGENSSDDSIDL